MKRRLPLPDLPVVSLAAALTTALAFAGLPAAAQAPAPAPAPAVAPAPPAPAQAPAPARSTARGARAATVTVNFVNADIEAVTRAFAAMLERPIVVDPRVRGQITVYSEQPQTVAQAFGSYQSALRGLGFAVVENSGLLKVVPEADAKLQAGTVSVGSVPQRGEQIITQIFPLRYENPNNLVAVLRPLITANNTINANPGSNSLVITDYADNLQRMSRIIAALDQPPGTDVEIVPLQHAVAADLAPLVQRLSDSGPGVPGVPGVAGGSATTVIADSRSNSLIVRAANPARLAQVKANIERLDRPVNLVGAGGGMWVVHLKNADAVKLATVVRAAFSALGGPPGSTGGATGVGATTPVTAAAPVAAGATQATAPVAASASPSTGGFIQADPATNSLIITAPEPLYRQVRALIDQLDTRRAQVYIESMIVEVDGADGVDLGFQWQGLLGQSGDRWGVATGTNFGATGNIIGITGAAAAGEPASAIAQIGQGLNIALLRNYGGVYSLAGILRALQSQTATNVVSTPNLITLDNEEAKIVVGENVPFITGQFTQTGGATTNPFQTIERKDVGITLRIRPQIGENGAIRMVIFQEQSSVKSDVAAGTSNAGPSTTKRSIEGTVTVDDGQILVLGGLIEDRYETTRSKVPLLGDIPVVGGLFRSESRTRRRTNLMVFLRPVVMRDADASTRFSVDRYEQMRGLQRQAQPTPSAVLPINSAPFIGPSKPAPVNVVPDEGTPAKPVAP
ncbi:MAG: type II secretion system secretin GspD [Betaproteobacteria bacterium]|nr:type II secretion system secretin GspD [Betaproteobacteria bacterium]MCC6851864.1 type II secretion system secretin GspD [Rubrivivax sp.]